MTVLMESIPEWLVAVASPFPVYGATVMLIAAAERRWPAGRDAGPPDRFFNFALAFLLALALAAFNFAFAGIERLLPRSPLAAVRLEGFWQWTAGALAYAFLWDLLQYGLHRLQHRVPLLWRTHALHHDSEALQCTDALRNTVWAGLAQIVLVGLPLAAAGAHRLLHPTAGVLLFSVFGFYNHANLRIGHGPLTPVLSGPQFHRLHHGRNECYWNKNLAAFFPVIDILFGTYVRPTPGEFPPTGLPGRPQSRGGLRPLVAAMFGR